MANDDYFSRIDNAAKALKVDISGGEMAKLALSHQFTEDQLKAVSDVFSYLSDKKHETIINTMLRLSRLPMKVPKTFDNYDFSIIHGQNADRLRSLPNLSEVYAGRNIIFIGPPGVGKTHLAEAYGNACCRKGMKAYFLKANELNDKFTNARRVGRESSVVNGLVKPTCLIIDEMGRCKFDAENTELFFDMIDRRYQKEGPNTMIFTSNKQPAQWKECFSNNEALLCALDRLCDNAEIFTIKGISYRGKGRETLSAEAGTITA